MIIAELVGGYRDGERHRVSGMAPIEFPVGHELTAMGIGDQAGYVYMRVNKVRYLFYRRFRYIYFFVHESIYDRFPQPRHGS